MTEWEKRFGRKYENMFPPRNGDLRRWFFTKPCFRNMRNVKIGSFALSGGNKQTSCKSPPSDLLAWKVKKKNVTWNTNIQDLFEDRFRWVKNATQSPVFFNASKMLTAILLIYFYFYFWNFPFEPIPRHWKEMKSPRFWLSFFLFFRTIILLSLLLGNDTP